MRRIEDYGPLDPIYIFVGNDGEQVIIDTDALYEWCKLYPPKVWSVPLDEAAVQEMLRDNCIQLSRLQEMLIATVADAAAFSDPVIFLKTGTQTNGEPDALLCDGHHRYCVRWACRESFIDGYVLDHEQWEPFVIHGMPPRTREQVRRMKPRAPRQ